MSKLSLNRTYVYLEKCNWDFFTPFLRVDYDEEGIGNVLLDVTYNGVDVVHLTEDVIYIGVG